MGKTLPSSPHSRCPFCEKILVRCRCLLESTEPVRPPVRLFVALLLSLHLRMMGIFLGEGRAAEVAFKTWACLSVEERQG